MLKHNPQFAFGSGPIPADRYDELFSRNMPPHPVGRWDKPLTQARRQWHEGVSLLAGKGHVPGHLRALEALVDRMLLLTDNFRVRPGTDFVFLLDNEAEGYLAPKEARGPAPEVGHLPRHQRGRASLNRLMSLEAPWRWTYSSASPMGRTGTWRKKRSAYSAVTRRTRESSSSCGAR